MIRNDKEKSEKNMGRFDGILICTDLDGTLLQRDKSVLEKDAAAIEYFKAEGGLFTFVTGRMPFYVRDIYDVVHPNAPIGCINGGGLYDFGKGEYLWTQELSRDVLELVEYADRAIPDLGIQVNTFDVVYFCRENEAMKEFRAETGLPNITCDYREVSAPIAKILFGDHDEDKILRLAALLGAHPRAGEYDFIRSDKMLYEILPRGIHKGVALLQLARLLGIDPSRTVAVGDYNNDIGMLRQAGLGIAVANATEETKAAADHVTVSNAEGAIAHIIAALGEGTLPFA